MGCVNLSPLVGFDSADSASGEGANVGESWMVDWRATSPVGEGCGSMLVTRRDVGEPTGGLAGDKHDGHCWN